MRDALSTMTQVKLFMDNAALAINGATANPPAFTQTNIDAWKADISAARANVALAMSNYLDAEESLRNAIASRNLALNQLDLKQAAVSAENADIAIARENISKSTLTAPVASKIVKVWLEIGEVARPGTTAVSLSTSRYKIQADVSELDIGKIHDGDEVSIKLDAFPGEEWKGKVASVEPREVIKDSDKYYRLNVYFDQDVQETIRPAMSADLEVHAVTKENVVAVPEVAIYKKGDVSYVKIMNGNTHSPSRQLDPCQRTRIAR